MDGLSEKVFAFIQQYQQTHQWSPTFPEIADGCHISLRTAYKHVKRLQESGYIVRREGAVRAIEIVKA